MEKKGPDKEFQALKRLITILEGLPQEARQRVAQYAIDRAFKPIPPPTPCEDPSNIEGPSLKQVG